jgi:hypothetical protein
MSDMSNDGYDDLDDDLEDGADQGRQSNPVNDLRAKLRRETKARKEAEALRDELQTKVTTFETTARKETVGSLFKDLGLTARPDLYPADREVSKDAVREFAKEFLGVEVRAEESADEAEQEQVAEGFTPVQLSGSVPAKGNISVAQYNAMLTQGRFAEAAKLLNDGRVTDIDTTSSLVSEDW